MELRTYAAEVIRQEAAEVSAMADRLDESFDNAVALIQSCMGRVIVSGLGKSGIIARKIAATFNSTGISSFFLHPAEAVHGDLGLMRPDDILLLISKSGQMGEMEMVIAAANRLGVKTIGLGGTFNSPLHQKADIYLDCSVKEEACPNNIMPTSSTTVTMVMGDALALALLKARNFSLEEFAEFHPAGFIGQRLLKRVSELHHSGDALPLVKPEATIMEMLLEMTRKRLGCVFTTDAEGKLAGVFTDGDLRRLIEKKRDFYGLTAAEVMHKNPKAILESAILDAALNIMERHSITQLATVDAQGKLAGVIHLHDILKSKLV
ncbi:MAG: KpsF/GutQ family sugar-phosphate isomerase [Candidatus Zixiibacteriota bacterium]